MHHIFPNSRLLSRVLVRFVCSDIHNLSLSVLDRFLVSHSLLDTGIPINLGTARHETTVLQNLLGRLAALSLLQQLE